MARPPTVIDPHRLEALMRLKPTKEDTASFFQCSPSTIDRFIRDNYGQTYAEFRDAGMVHTRFEMIRRAIERSKTSDAILIFCLKNLCGWRDRQEEEVDKSVINNMNLNTLSDLSPEKIKARIAELQEKLKGELKDVTPEPPQLEEKKNEIDQP
jgi:hypothetical protein